MSLSLYSTLAADFHKIINLARKIEVRNSGLFSISYGLLEITISSSRCHPEADLIVVTAPAHKLSVLTPSGRRYCVTKVWQRKLSHIQVVGNEGFTGTEAGPHVF